MTDTMDDNIKENPALFAVVAEANKALDEIRARWLLEFSATWRMIQEPPHRPLLEVTLADYLATLSRRFSPEELANPGQRASPFYRFWNDFFEVFSRKHRARLHQLVSELDKE